jgi:DNA polymerase-1
MSHDSPNMGQVTAGTKIYGNEMRECWVVREGYSLVGMDASGLELRMLAHYMNDDTYTKEVLDGDVHTANQRAAGLPSRDTAKTFIYAFLYGAGDAKIGSIVSGSVADGKRLKAKFLRNTPALASLRERVTTAAKRGWLRGLDGRRLTIRSPHAALNTLLQGAGAVVMKQALVNLDTMVKAQALDAKFVGNIHDEIQAEVLSSEAEKYGKLAAYAMSKAGTDFNLNVPLAGEYKIGSSWRETH